MSARHGNGDEAPFSEYTQYKPGARAKDQIILLAPQACVVGGRSGPGGRRP
jgi:hypothetical protein